MTTERVRSSVLRDFLRSKMVGGILLMIAAALAMLVVNSPLSDAYSYGLHVYLVPLSLLH